MLIQNLNYSQSLLSSVAFQSSRLAWLVGESILFHKAVVFGRHNMRLNAYRNYILYFRTVVWEP